MRLEFLYKTMEESNNDSDEDTVQFVYTADEVMEIGLYLVGFKKRRIKRAKKATNMERF